MRKVGNIVGIHAHRDRPAVMPAEGTGNSLGDILRVASLRSVENEDMLRFGAVRMRWRWRAVMHTSSRVACRRSRVHGRSVYVR